MNVRIFDTTLRDGEQSPGATMSAPDRLRIALALEAAGVDVIEAGFPAASPSIAASVQQIATHVQHATVTAFSRANAADIDKAWDAIRDARRPRLFSCIATSEEHMAIKLHATRDTVLGLIESSVRRMKSYTDDVHFAAEDGSRTDPEFLVRAFAVAVKAGATGVILPDTVGFMQPREFGDLVRYVRERIPDTVTLSVHCHDDLGVAVANTLEAVLNGANEVQVTVNGIGERAGNCSLEEVAVALRVRESYFGVTTDFKTEHIARLSEMVAAATDMPVAKNKAIVGKHAFMHESGIHQDGVLKKRSLYEVIPAELVGRAPGQLSFGRNSGRNGLRSRCESLGIVLTKDQVDHAYQLFLGAADEARGVDDAQILAIANAVTRSAGGVFEVAS